MLNKEMEMLVLKLIDKIQAVMDAIKAMPDERALERGFNLAELEKAHLKFSRIKRSIERSLRMAKQSQEAA
ncbi:hypothetical protein MAIT1_04393 [Magnetofaba australis IT-1]|uniref:Uncharacterized protein n=2 Tax=Magnetofaba TaxID=1472292 RepID=A0A1Y2KA81_9PROT|nr:hypothetical protein MAIT1_04393 [Magnetofaba australis IT-1]